MNSHINPMARHNRLPRSRRPQIQALRRGGAVSIARIRGLTLIELMIAMVLGLIVVGSAGAIFISNQQTYRATEALGRVQESGRMAFELMSRDVREAGGNPCSKDLPMANVLNDPASQWWSSWNNGIRGYEGSETVPGLPTGTAINSRIAGTDAIELMSGDNSSGVTIVSHNPTSAQFQLNTINHSLEESDIAIACDFRQAALFQVTNSQSGTNEVIVHNLGTTVTPGNCSKGLGFPTDCTPNGTPYEFGPNSTIVRLHAVRWYIGRGEGGRNSLFRSNLVNQGGVVGPMAEEIVDGVDNMNVQYLIGGTQNYIAATDVTAANRWRDVVAVRIELDLASADAAGVGGVTLQRTLSHTVALRNRMQ